MFRCYLAAQRDGVDFYLADIPEDFDTHPAEQFAPVYMRQLFDLRYKPCQIGLSLKTHPSRVLSQL